MSTQTSSSARAPTARGVEALASASIAALWGSMSRILPIWCGLALFFAMNHMAAPSDGSDGRAMQETLENEIWVATTLFATALASAVALRAFLGAWREALKPNGALWGFVGIVMLAGVAPAVMLMRLHLPTLEVLRTEGPQQLISRGFSLAFGLALFGAFLRLTLWPIARLFGDRRVTAEQSWILMRGAAGPYAGALVLLTAPLLVINVALMALTAHASPLIRDAATAPLRAAITLIVVAVASEVYRKRLHP